MLSVWEEGKIRLYGEHANFHQSHSQNDSVDLRGVAGGDGELGCLCGKAGTSHLYDGSAHSSGCVVWNAVPAKSKGHSAWLKSISYSIFGENRSSTRFLPGKIVLLLDFFYSFTEKCNRSFTRFYRSPTRYFTRCFVKSIFHPFDFVDGLAYSHTQGGRRPRSHVRAFC